MDLKVFTKETWVMVTRTKYEPRTGGLLKGKRKGASCLLLTSKVSRTKAILTATPKRFFSD